MPAENRSLQPLLGQKSISLKSRTEGVICLCRLQQWVINWQRSKHCTRMPIKALYQLWEPWTMREYFTDIHSDFKKCFLNTERSSINSTFNASVEGIPTYSAAETAERISMDQPKAALWEVIQANNISFLGNSCAWAAGRTQIPKWEMVQLHTATSFKSCHAGEAPNINLHPFISVCSWEFGELPVLIQEIQFFALFFPNWVDANQIQSSSPSNPHSCLQCGFWI